MIVEHFNANQVRPSNNVGLHPQLISYEVARDDGINVGSNNPQVVAPGGSRTYRWYAGDLKMQPDGKLVATPVEFGAINLSSSDLIKHSNKGAVAALVIEPKESTWKTDFELNKNRKSRTAATIKNAAGNVLFREFVTIFQDDLNFRFGHKLGDGTIADDGAVPNTADAEDAEDSGQKALNYRSEPMWLRTGFAPNAPLGFTRTLDFKDILTNGQVGGDPETPVFTAAAGDQVRFRVLQPGGHPRNHVFTVNGHVWQELPYVVDSTKIGDNKAANGKFMTMFEGARMGHGPTNHFDVVLQNGAGGKFLSLVTTSSATWHLSCSMEGCGVSCGLLNNRSKQLFS